MPLLFLQSEGKYISGKKYIFKDFMDGKINEIKNLQPTEAELSTHLGTIFTENRLTDEGNTPSDDIFCVKLSPGRAYVKGFDIDLPGTTVLDVDKPRTTKTIEDQSIIYNTGPTLKINNVNRTPSVGIGSTYVFKFER